MKVTLDKYPILSSVIFFFVSDRFFFFYLLTFFFIINLSTTLIKKIISRRNKMVKEINKDAPSKHDDLIALFRLQVITPMLNAPEGQINSVAKQLSSQKFTDVLNQKIVTFSYSTIYRYYMNYKKYGFNGLKPKVYKNKGTNPSFPDEIIKALLKLKEELPSRSAYKIITMLELAKKIEKGSLNVRSVNRIFNNYDYTTKVLQNKTRVYVNTTT